MPTTYLDQFWLIDPYAPPPPGTLLTVSKFTIVDQNDNDLINRFSNDSIDGVDIRASYAGDTITVQLADGSTTTITGVTFYLADGRTLFTPSDGSVLEDATLVSTSWVSGQSSLAVGDLGPSCFTPGTLIATATGNRPVESLHPGDLVETADDGPMPLRLVHRRRLSAAHLAAHPDHGPVRIRAGALGRGLPGRDLTVSPQHRIMLRSAIAERMFGEAEILVPACQLAGFPGIDRLTAPQGVEYLHLLFDRHAIVFAERSPAESLYLGAVVHESLTPREIDAIRARLPQLRNGRMQPARLFVRGRRLRSLLERHLRNGKPLVSVEMKPRSAPLHALA